MASKSVLHLGQNLRGRAGAYRITEQLSEFIYSAMYVTTSETAFLVPLLNTACPIAINREAVSWSKVSKAIGVFRTSEIFSNASKAVPRLCGLSLTR
jgi:hypothetical protein